MSMLIAQAMSERASGIGQPSITVLDECWSLLESPNLADSRGSARSERPGKRCRKRVGNLADAGRFRRHKAKAEGARWPGILRNASVKVIGQQPGDVSPLVEHLALNEVALTEIKRFATPQKGRSAEVLLVLGEKSETTKTVRACTHAGGLLGSHHISARTGPTARTFSGRNETASDR